MNVDLISAIYVIASKDGLAMEFSEQTYREVSLKRHMTVQIPKGINDAMEDFLKTAQAEKMGFNTKSDLITTAVRNVLTQYGHYDRYLEK